VRIAIVSDTHLPRGRRRIPDRCWAEMAAADLIVHAGDFTAVEVLHDLEALGPPVAAVHGNIDSPELRSRLPEARMLEAGGARIALVHDAGPARGRLARMQRRFPDSDAVVFGHSHIPIHERSEGFQLFNPGSPTDRRRQPRHTMGRALVSAGALEFEVLQLD
jgi:putative phosphoesterase